MKTRSICALCAILALGATLSLNACRKSQSGDPLPDDTPPAGGAATEGDTFVWGDFSSPEITPGEDRPAIRPDSPVETDAGGNILLPDHVFE